MRKDWFEDDNEIRLLHRGKRRLLDIVFGRTMVITLLLVLQIAIMVLGAHYLGRYYPALTIVLRVMSVAVIIYLVNKSGSATTKITWIILVMALPAFGVLLYLFVQLDIGHRYANRRVQESILSTVQYVPRQTELMAHLRTELPEVHNLAEYTLRSGDYPVYENTAVTYYPMGQDKIGALIEALQSAEHFIFLEYFIINPGEMWNTVLEILKEKVKEGVEVRLIYDDIGSVFYVPKYYWREMESYGIKCMAFNQVVPFLATIFNNRDHRKITVIDGKVAYTGGMNLADEYINARVRFGYWKDAAIRLTGECVWSFTSMFLELWDYILKIESDYTFYRATSMEKHRLQEKIHADEKGFVQPYTDSPLDHEDVGENVYLNIISRAKKYLYIFTPYLIIGSEMRTALVNAAKSGVDVRLVVPGIPDKKLVYFLTQSNFPYLIKNGVKIYTYTPGFIHAKCFVSDDVQATVGTVNMDYRSLCLHFECGVWMYRTRAVLQVKEDALKTFAESHEVTLEEFQRKSFLVRTFMGALKLFAPLL